MAVEVQHENSARRAFSAFSLSNECFARDESLCKRVGGVEDSRNQPKLRSWRCTQSKIAKATTGVAVAGKMTPKPRAATIVRHTLLAGGARNSPR